MITLSPKITKTSPARSVVQQKNNAKSVPPPVHVSQVKQNSIQQKINEVSPLIKNIEPTKQGGTSPVIRTSRQAFIKPGSSQQPLIQLKQAARPLIQQKNVSKNAPHPFISRNIATKPSIILQKKEDANPVIRNAEGIKSYITTPIIQPSRPAVTKIATTPAPVVQKKQLLQLKLEIGQPNDHFEQEADHVADRIVSMPDPQAANVSVARNSTIQRSIAERISAVHNSADYSSPLRGGYQPVIQRRVAGVSEATRIDVESKLNNSSGRGSPMDERTQNYFGSRFGADFSGVKVHTDQPAIQMNRALGSHAFAYGNNIFFNENQYNPASGAGRRLIAHELTHVVQQGGAARRKPSDMSIARAPPSVQGFGISDIRRMINNVAINIPGFQLVTTIIGYNFILGESVPRTSANLILGFLRLVPPLGTAIAATLQSSEKFQEACAWIDAQIASLGLSMDNLLATLNRALDAFSLSDLLSPGAAIDRTINFFRPYFTRVVNFASSVFNRVVQFLKETVLRPLSDFARTLPGYPLLCVIMGRDPITGIPVPRTAENFVRGFMSLMPGGEEKFQQVQQSGAIPRAAAWLEEQVQTRNLTWARISGTFQQAWNSLSPADILHPIDTIQRIAGIFRPLLSDILGFVVAALEKILELIFAAVMGAGGSRVVAILQRVRSTFLIIIRDPVGFLRNLINAVKQGIRQFATNILTHLRNGLIEWLVGGLTRAGVQLPEQWDLRGILSFVLQILGITYPNIRTKMVRLIGERPVTILETGFELVTLLVTQGPMAAWQRILEHIGNMRDMVMNGIRSWIQQRIVVAAITRLATMFNPVGAVLQAILATYNTVMFFIERINQIMAMVESVVNSIAAIAAGNIGAAANYVEQSMARTIPIILSFLARLIGIGDIADPIRRVIQTIQQRVDAAIDRVIEWIRNAARSLLAMGRSAVAGIVQWWRARKQFTSANGETHSIYFQGEGASARMMLASDPVQIASWLSTVNRTGMAPAKITALNRIQPLLTEADAIKNAAAGTTPARTMDQVMEDLKTQIQLIIGDDVLRNAKAFPAFSRKYFKPSSLVEFIMNAEGVSDRTAERRISTWKGSNDLKEVSSSPTDPYKQFSFDLPGGARAIPDASKRQIFGFNDNVDKGTADGFTVMMKGFSDAETRRRNPGATAAQLANQAWIRTNGWFYSPRAPHRNFFQWADAIMGHDDSPGHGGASGYWNSGGGGHSKTLGENRIWNRDPVNYWGPEHSRESSASGSAAARYNDPRPNYAPAPPSHVMWWHSAHPEWPGTRYSGYTNDYSAYYNLSGAAI